MEKQRLDVVLVEKGLASSREKAKALIMAGKVLVDEKKIDRIEAIITSMTKKERNNPSIINSSRKKRIADGSGTQVHDVNQFLKSFEQMQKLMKQFSNPKKMKRAMGSFGNFFGLR